jgi:hypothetical protein
VTRLIRPAVLLAAVGALAAVLVACGGGSDDPMKLLKQTFSGDHKIKSGKLNVSIDVAAKGVQGLTQPVKISLTGPFQSQGSGDLPNFDLNLTFSGGGQSFSAGAVNTGEKGYLEFQGQAYEVPTNVYDQFKQGFEQAQDKGKSNNRGNALKQLGLDPLDWLKDPKTEGEEDVGGTNTKHVSADIDVPKFVDDLNVLLQNASKLGAQNASRLPQGITAQQRQQIENAVESATFDVWTGADDNTLRKLQLKLSIQGSNGQSGDLGFAVEIDDLNSNQTINAPANAKPLADLNRQLGGLGLGGALGGTGGSGSNGSSGSGSGSSGSSANSEKLQRYTQCLQSAGGDAAKAQKCADLLK